MPSKEIYTINYMTDTAVAVSENLQNNFKTYFPLHIVHIDSRLPHVQHRVVDMAAPAPKRPCRYFRSKEGCKNKNCNFSHNLRTTRPFQYASSSSPAAPRRIQFGRNTPRNICEFYRNTGQCKRGFDCTFKHQNGTNTRTDTEVDDEDAANAALDFFTVDNLTHLAGVGLHSTQEGTPENAHNVIKQYLGGGSLNKPAEMSNLISILASVNGRNRSWTVDKAQEFLGMLIRSDKILSCIGDILKFPNVSPKAGAGSTLLSFQLGYFPVLEYFTSDLVLKSTLHHNINALYASLYEHWAYVSVVIESSMKDMIANRTWNDLTRGLPERLQGKLTGMVVFKTIADLIIQIFNRFKTALETYPQLNGLVEHLTDWFEVWATGVQSNPPTFQDPVASHRETCKVTIQTLKETIERLRAIIGREHHATEVKRVVRKKPALSEVDKIKALLMQLELAHDPASGFRPDEPRHDNDFADIAQIRICPTSDELRCPIPPYLPVTTPGAPHHLPAGSMERHLDVQFRLLREDLTFPIRESLNVLQGDLDIMWTQSHKKTREKTELDKVLANEGGLYRSSGKNSVIFTIYTDVHYAHLSTRSQGIETGLKIRCPPGQGRDPDSKKRVDYWKFAGSKKLSSGSLVALVLVSRGAFRVYLANLVSSPDDISESAKRSERYIQVKCRFFDPEVEIEALRKEKITIDENTFAILIDNGVMFESVRPFLKTLSSIDSTSIPFNRYICEEGQLNNVQIRPPKYATATGFRFNLQSVAKPGRTIHPLDINNPASVARARAQLRHFSVLDPSQADSVVDSLTREVSLIQGPPGTGKSYTGKELLRIFFDNKIKPIVLIAFTNHALDHMLNSVLDAKITDKLVRLGSRSSDERIAQYSLRNLEMTLADPSMSHQIGRELAAKKRIEEEMLQVLNDIQIPEPSEDQIKAYLQRHWGEHLSKMYEPPFWIAEYAAQLWESEGGNGEGEWKVRWKKGKGKGQSHFSRTHYGLWKRGLDIAFIQPPEPQFVEYPLSKRQKKMGAPPNVMVVQPTKEEQDNYKERVSGFFSKLGYGDEIPPPPNGNRPVGQLLDSPAVWSMSVDERRRLAKHWEEGMRRLAYQEHLEEYQALREQYEEACENFEAVCDERKRRLLNDVDLIGCTTTGAAKLTSLLTSVQPRVLVVEEGGQVLEAHILASLVDSVQHLICIGDPKQLRPNLATYSLSMDSERGKRLFKFDRSLMERLADNGFPMSQINVQRRMRPSISHHIRTILYPKLEDNEIVENYPDVKGMSENVVFFTHDNKEDGGQDSASKVNTFEVNMIVDMVMYFLRQGEYNNQGDIAVLCAYLGQLQKLRAALRSLKVTVAVDERDETQLVKQGLQDDDETQLIEEVEVAKHVRLGTVDIFQGQEAKIVIVSLVRNSGEFETDNATIGFLKSENRINVALSRAKHGLYVLGNASNLRKNSTWSTILDEMETMGQIGFGFPIVCARHPEQVKVISEPGQLPKVAPLGGCLLPCEFKLGCGHNCRSTCHADLDNHKSTLCYENCPRLACIRQHPCVRRCHQPCGDCKFPISNVTMPCGHIEKQVPCHLLEDLTAVKCQKMVLKKLPYCEHSQQVACFKDPASAVCIQLCDQPMGCCSKKCKGRCGDCQKLNLDVTKVRSGPIKRINHPDHPCERALYCQHLCGLPCHPKDQGCNNECQQSCRQRCIHHKCRKLCSVTCAPCLEACPWKCDHHQCPVACGSICARLPCDERCTKTLECGHSCPSVCGEPCAIQKCVACMSDEAKTTIVDFIMQRAISGLDTTSDGVSEMLITLECGHIFTVETLDGHCSMSEYYETDLMTDRYLKMKAPPIKYQTPPTCPTCRGPITSPRYGRITKRANLDILEQNVASSMSKRLETHGPSLEAIAANLEASETAAKAIAEGDPGDFASEDDFTQICARRRESFGKADGPLPVHMLRKMRVYHGFSEKECVEEDLRSAHIKAYEAAMTTLFDLEMKALAFDPSKVDGKTQHEAAFESVNAKVGQPPHKADRKFHIEAFLLSIELRLMLAQIASARVSGLPLTPNTPDRTRHRHIWTTFVSFLYDSCIGDCAKARELARSCSALRQEARVSLVDLRCTFEKMRFDVLEERRKIQILDRSEGDQTRMRATLGTFVSQQRAIALESLLQIRTKYFQNRPINSRDEMDEEILWFKENCTSRAEKVFFAYKDLREHVLKAEVFQQSVTLQEKQDIVKAFGFGHAGHFYNCENGHTFVITECGGAMQASTCPECRAPIGGGSHALIGVNTRAIEFEQLARAAGATENPWAPGGYMANAL